MNFRAIERQGNEKLFSKFAATTDEIKFFCRTAKQKPGKTIQTG